MKGGGLHLTRSPSAPALVDDLFPGPGQRDPLQKLWAPDPDPDLVHKTDSKET